MLKGCIKSYLNTRAKPRKHFILIISNSDGKLYYKGKNKPLKTREGELKLADAIERILGKKRLRTLGFDEPRNKVAAEQAVMLNGVKEELPSASDVVNADDMELQEIAKSTEDLIT